MDNNSFFSIDRLLEFGMSMAVAQQMINTMNASLGQMVNGFNTVMQAPIPGSKMPAPTLQQPQQLIYVAIDGQQVGPLSDSDFSHLVSQKKVNKDTLVWMPGMQNWQPIENVPAILKIIALTPPALPTRPGLDQIDVKQQPTC